MRRQELYALVTSDAEAIEWCRTKGLLTRNIVCPVCQTVMKASAHHGSDGAIWRCTRTTEGERHFKTRSIRERSFFAESKLTIRTLIYLLYEWSIGTSVEQSAFQLELERKTVTKHYSLFRKLCAWRIEQQGAQRPGGVGSVVEVDVCQVGRRKAHRGRVPREIWVVGGLDRHSNPQKIFLEVTRRRNKRALNAIIARNIDLETHVITDGWGGYQDLGSLGFRHSVVNHSHNFVNPQDPSIHTQGIENVWRCLRRFLRSKGTNICRHLDEYLKEFLFRKLHCDMFESILSTIQDKFPLT